MIDHIPTQHTEQQKNIRIILLILLVVVLSVGVSVFIWKTQKSSPLITSTPIQESGEGLASEETQETSSSSEILVRTQDPYIQIYTGDVGGYTLLEDNKIRLFDKKKGFVVDIQPGEEKETLVNANPILYTHDAYFIDENKLILRSLDDKNTIKTHLYTIQALEKQSLQIQTTFSDNVREIAISPNKKYIALLIQEETGSKVDVVDIEKEKITTLFRSPLQEWIPSINNEQEIVLTAKAASFAQSGVYVIQNNSLRTFVRAENALTASLSPNHTYIFSTRPTGTWSPKIHSLFRDNPTETAVSINLSTIADKCAWSKDEKTLSCGEPITPQEEVFIDKWYLGDMFSADIIAQYTIGSERPYRILSESFMKQKIDITQVQHHDTTQNVYFVDKKTGNLWMVTNKPIDTHEQE